MLPFLLYGLIAVVTIIVGLIVYARWNFGTLEKLGIPVVKLKSDHFLLGSALATFETPGGFLDIENMKKYGPVFGLYEGREPQVFICDAELTRAITTKDADHFDAKRVLDFGDPIMNELPDFLVGEKWRVVRNMISPVFSSTARLKYSNPSMRGTISEYIAGIKGKINDSGKGKLEKFALDESIFAVLTELIARSYFTVSIDKSADINNRFVQNVRVLMTPPAVQAPAIAVYSYAFPFMKHFLPNTMINPEPIKEFVVIVKQLMEMRRNERKNSAEKPDRADFLDSIIEWYDNLESPEMKKHNITENNIWNLGMALFLGGQDQMSLIIAVMMYYASKDREMERKLQAEVDKVFAQNKGDLDHDALADMPYLTACITESLRLYPFFFRSERVCTKDWSCPERGFRITKGTVVQLSIWATNRNPEYFEDPEEFKPERFLPGNKEKLHPYAFTSFGFGPRNCVGKRLAMEILVLMGAYLLKELRFVGSEDTRLKFLPAGPFFGAHEPIFFDVVARNEE